MTDESLKKFHEVMSEKGFLYQRHYSPVIMEMGKWRFEWRAYQPNQEQQDEVRALFESHFAGYI